MNILILKEDHMKSIFAMKDAIQADKDALEIYSKKGANIPLRTNISVPEHKGQSLYMPGYASDSKSLGIKIVSVYPENREKGIDSVPATMVLQNEETGEVCALMDGGFLTKIRTGAVSGAATDILARKDSKIFALFGTGGQAESQLEAVLNVRNIEIVRVYSPSEEKRNDFVKRMSHCFSEKFSVKIEAVASSDEAICDADIITVATTSKVPVFNGKGLKKGVHINGVGSYTPEMQEVDEHVICNAKVYVDTKDGVFSEAGDLIVPVKKEIYSFDRVSGELGEVILGKVKGRENNEEITFFKSVGSSVLDIVTARRIYEKALEKTVGDMIVL